MPKNCVNKYVKCPRGTSCRVKTGRCIKSKPEGDKEYVFADKKFYISKKGGKVEKQLLENEYKSTRRSSRVRREPERLGVLTGSKYRRGVKRGIKKEEANIIQKFKVLEVELQKDLINAPQKEFDATIRELAQAPIQYFPIVPITASPNGLSQDDRKLLERLRNLEFPLGKPPSPIKYEQVRGSRMRTPEELDIRRLQLYEDNLDDEYIPSL